MAEVKLFEHQKKALKDMRNGCILYGGVGTGKSMTALAYYMIKVSGGSYSFDDIYTPPKKEFMRKLFIITTARKRNSKEWIREINRWDLSEQDVVIDSWNNIKKYKKVRDAFFIFDEQKVTGKGAWVGSFINIARHNKWILLTATPGDSWLDYAPVFIANGYYRDRKDFIWQHVEYDPFITKFPKIRRFINTDILEERRKELLVLMKYDKPILLHHKDLNVLYDFASYTKVKKERWDIYTNEPIKDAAGYYRCLRRVVNSSKQRIDAVADLCQRTPRVIIFYSFDYELELLREMCSINEFVHYEWNGHKHEELPVGIDCKWVYLVQYKAASEAWECITTNVMIFYSQSYSYKDTVQAAGRIDRLNTPYKDLYYYHVKSDASIDKVISESLNRKEEFNESIYLEELLNEDGIEENPFAY